MDEKRVVITGATGMVGGCALRICLESPNVSMATAISRKSTGIDDARLREVLVDDVITRRLTCRISINPVQPHLINSDSYKPSDYQCSCPVYAIRFLMDKVFCNPYDSNFLVAT